jgi:hypothetical protein
VHAAASGQVRRCPREGWSKRPSDPADPFVVAEESVDIADVGIDTISWSSMVPIGIYAMLVESCRSISVCFLRFPSCVLCPGATTLAGHGMTSVFSSYQLIERRGSGDHGWSGVAAKDFLLPQVFPSDGFLFARSEISRRFFFFQITSFVTLIRR